MRFPILVNEYTKIGHNFIKECIIELVVEEGHEMKVIALT